ncbi:hypothetical protein ACGFXC_29335 [Streptomyces sp. NPDC048507]|uniref:hypothetical protein n=1 Tax=Streptomyces sp. NPDC048507 TaxID=3365560 RepID=UPI00371B9062
MEHAPPLPELRGAPRRRGRTPLLIVAALVLGAVAGTATGYAVQYHRAPTPLAPLAQQELPAPRALAADDATTRRSVNANRWHATDGDLVDLLVEPPADAKALDRGYDSIDAFTADFEEPDLLFRVMEKDGFRRAASAHWVQGDIDVLVQLVQFKDFSGADGFQQGQAAYLPEAKYAGNGGVSLPGVSPEAGRAWVYSKTSQEPGYLPIREARAVARRGDTVVLVYYADKRARDIAEGAVTDLAKRQLERL